MRSSILCTLHLLLLGSRIHASAHLLSEHIDEIIHLLARIGNRRLGSSLLCTELVPGDKRILLASLIKQLMTLYLQIVLSLSKHGSDHLTERCVQEFIGQIYDLFGDPFADQELSTLIREVVAVMLEHIVCSLSKSRRHISKKLHE